MYRFDKLIVGSYLSKPCTAYLNRLYIMQKAADGTEPLTDSVNKTVEEIRRDPAKGLTTSPTAYLPFSTLIIRIRNVLYI